MGKSAPFGRPGASDRLRLWWHGTSKTSRMNALMFLVVGTISAGLVWAGVSGDAARTRGAATASRPQVSIPSSLATIPTALDLRTAGAGPAPNVVGDPASTTTTTTSPPGAVVVPTTPPARVQPAATATAPASPSPSPVTTVPNPQIVFTEVPVPATAPEPTVPPTPSSSVPTTTPPATTPPATAPSTTSPPSTSSPSTTKGSTLPPLPLDVPLLRP